MLATVRLPERIRTALTLTRFQAIVGITAGFLSIGATVWGLLFASRTPATSGEVVTIVQEARTEKRLADATVELLTSKDALVTTLQAKNGQVRQIQVLAGQSQEIHVRLAPRAEKASPLDKAGAAIKNLFR